MTTPTTERLLRIQEVAEEVDLTPRAIRHYESLGLLEPAARSDGDYRLYDADDLERLRFIKGLRDDAGFSLAEIGLLLEDEAARALMRERFASTTDPAERRVILDDAIVRVDRQIATLRAKAERLAAMVEAAEARRRHLLQHVDQLETGRPHTHDGVEPIVPGPADPRSAHRPLRGTPPGRPRPVER